MRAWPGGSSKRVKVCVWQTFWIFLYLQWATSAESHSKREYVSFALKKELTSCHLRNGLQGAGGAYFPARQPVWRLDTVPVLGKQLWGTAGDFELKTKSHQPRNPLHESGKEEHMFITEEALSQNVMVCQTLC